MLCPGYKNAHLMISDRRFHFFIPLLYKIRVSSQKIRLQSGAMQKKPSRLKWRSEDLRYNIVW